MSLSPDEAEKVIRQICEGKDYYDPDSEYFDGESQRYFFYRADEEFCLQRIDVIIASYMFTETVSKEYLLNYFLTQHKSDLEQQGFKFM